jgi:chorismate dehydratase
MRNRQKIRVSAVSFTNSIPFVQGIIRSALTDKIQLSLDTPAICADKLLFDKADIGLVPIATIHNLSYYRLVSDFCLSAAYRARTVLLIGEKPLNEITEIYLDSDSRTSVILAQILANRFWPIGSVRWVRTTGEFSPDTIKGSVAAVVIGDKAFQVENKYPLQVDLAEEWRKYTGLPFVFACWVANKDIDIDFLSVFNQALAEGVSNISRMIEYQNGDVEQNKVLLDYLENNIYFLLDEGRKKAIELFLQYKTELEKAGTLV